MASASSPTPYDDFYLASNILSIFGGAMVFYMAYKSPRPITIPVRLLVLMSLSHLVCSSINIFKSMVTVSDFICTAIITVKVSTMYSAIFFTCLMALFVYFVLASRPRKELVRDINRLIIISASLSIIFAFLPPIFHFINLNYVNDPGYCDILYIGPERVFPKFLAFVLTYGLTFALVVSATVAACIRGVYFFRDLPEGLVRAHNLNGMKLLLYPIAQILIYAPSFGYELSMIGNNKTDETPSNWIIVTSSFYNLGGFLNFLVYGLQFIRTQRQRMLSGTQNQQHLNEKEMKEEEL